MTSTALPKLAISLSPVHPDLARLHTAIDGLLQARPIAADSLARLPTPRPTDPTALSESN
jgi:hypothetical protein